MSFSSIGEDLKNGNFESLLQNAGNELKKVESGRQLEKIFEECSLFLYNQKAISKEQLSSMAEVIVLSLRSGVEQTVEVNATNVLKSLCYIFVHSVKKGLDVEMSVALIMEIELRLNTCQDFTLNNSTSMKNIYLTLWNLSLRPGVAPSDSLLLQGHALSFFCLAGDNLTEVCKNCQRVAKLAENASCSTRQIEAVYQKVLLTIVTYLKRKPSINVASVVALNLVLIDYVKCLYQNQNYIEFSKVFKPLAAVLVAICESKVAFSFKMSMKIIEIGMAFTVQHCTTEEHVSKMLKGCYYISKSCTVANTLLMDALIFCHQWIAEKGNEEMSRGKASTAESVFSALRQRITSDSHLPPETILKTLERFESHLSGLMGRATGEAEDREGVLARAAALCPCLRLLLGECGDAKADVYVYNAGVHCCNLGGVAFKCASYDVAAQLLDVGVEYLNRHYDTCTDAQQKGAVLVLLGKKGSLLKDSLRYAGRLREAGGKVLSLAARGLLPPEDVVPAWIKCKRDARRKGAASQQRIQGVCLKDIYDDVESEVKGRSLLHIEELLVEELRALEQLSFDTSVDVLRCCSVLRSSPSLSLRLEGALSLVKVLWRGRAKEAAPPGGGQSALGVVTDALREMHEAAPPPSDSLLEHSARAHLWLYLCHLQLSQGQAEAELEAKQKEEEAVALSAASADLGEEVNPHDACSLRPATRGASFEQQDRAMLPLHQALHAWETAIKSPCGVSRPPAACQNLFSIGSIYKLRGLLPSSIKAFALIVAVANRHGLNQWWIHGVCELMEVCPELISGRVAMRLEALLGEGESERGKERGEVRGDKKREKETAEKLPHYFTFWARSTLAYYYYRTGEFLKGGALIVSCLSSPSLMEKQTAAATEVQIWVYFVASLYAFLPSSVLPKEARPTEPCLFLALFATRKAIALVNLFLDDNQHDNVCWRHKVGWFHHVTNLWLGNLCHLTAQPRLARAYLRQALTLAEKLALPFRMMELLSTLAEIDVQCGQLDDCRVKMDTMDHLLRVHAAASFDDADWTTGGEPLPLPDWNTFGNLKKKERGGTGGGGGVVLIHADESALCESLRETACSPDLRLAAPLAGLAGQLVVVGAPARIGPLAAAGRALGNQCPSSPSIAFREEAFTVRSMVCPKGVARCPVCVAPGLQAAAVKAKGLMALIHAHRSNRKGALLSLEQGEADLEMMMSVGVESERCLRAALGVGDTMELGLATEEEEEGKEGRRSVFFDSHLAPVKLVLWLHRVEVRCLAAEDWPGTEGQAADALRDAAAMSPLILTLNHVLVLQLLLQGHAVHRCVQNVGQETEDKVEVLPDSPPAKSSSKSDAPCPFRTPVRSTLKKKLRNRLPGPHHPPAPQLGPLAPITPFRIFTDDDNSSAEKNDDKEIKNLSSTFGKLTVERSPNSAVRSSSSLSPLSSLNSSPFSHVLQLPNREDEPDGEAAKDAPPKGTKPKPGVKGKTAAGGSMKDNRFRKLLSNKTASVDSSAVQQDSPIIKVNFKPVGGASRKGNAVGGASKRPTTRVAKDKLPPSTKATGELSAPPTTRETRSRRNLQRL